MPLYCSIDLETTGLDPNRHKIVEFAAVKFDESGTVLSEFQSLANPGGFGIPVEAIEIHGITDAMIEDAPSPIVVWQQLLEWAGDCRVFVAHNAVFEVGFIRALYASQDEVPDLLFIDTLKISRNRLKDRSSYKLGALVPELSSGEAHRALPDAKACMTLMLRLAQTYSKQTIPASQAKPILEYDWSKANAMSERQRNFIEELGGDPNLVRTKSEASAYIDQLLAKTTGDNSAFHGHNRTVPSTNVAAIILTIFVTLALIASVLLLH